MKKHDPENERVKRDYFIYLREARRRQEASIDAVAAALHRFEAFTGFKSFRHFHVDQAIRFKEHLAEARTHRTKMPLSVATIHSTLAALKAFFLWLADRPGYRRRIRYADAEYFNMPERDARIAKASIEKAFPTLEQITHVVKTMPFATDIEKRNRALIAFAILTGARDGALASARLRHVDLRADRFVQDPREVQTKFGKVIITTFFPVGDPFREIVADWVDHLRRDLLWCDADPLFPKTRTVIGRELQLGPAGLERVGWRSAGPIRDIFRHAFTDAGLPYFHPHTFRKTIVQLGEQICRTPEEFKAWSQNLGHEGVLTTFNSYGVVASARQAEIILGIGKGPGTEERRAALIRELASTL